MNLPETLAAIRPLNRKASNAARKRQGQLTKPPGSLGRLEELSIWLAGVTGSEKPSVRQKSLIVAAADHGVVAQGVTGYPQAVTAQMVLNFLAGGAAVTVMARHAGGKVVVVDAGVASDLPAHAALKSLGLPRGTADMSRGPAMTKATAVRALEAGIALAEAEIQGGAELLALGDMGIGNTTASSAIAAAITGQSPVRTTGKGTGRTSEEVAHKARVIGQALEVNSPNGKDGLDVLAKVGGQEIGVLAGVILGAAAARRPVVLDGFISGAAALVACTLAPQAKSYLVASHRSAEQGHRLMLKHLGLRPLLDLKMRLGEGTGAVLACGIIEASAACLSEMATFAEAGVANRLED